MAMAKLLGIQNIMDFSNLVEKEQLLHSKGFYHFDKYSPVIMYEDWNKFMVHVRREIKLRNYEIDISGFDVMYRESPDLELRLNELREQWENIVLYCKQLKMEKQLQQLEKDFE